LDKEVATSSGGFLKMVYEGNVEALRGVLPQYCVDVRDTARLHVAAVKYDDVADRRIFPWVKPYNWNLVLKVLRELRPEHKFSGDLVPDPGEDLSVIENGDDEKLLVRMGVEGWVPFREMLDEGLKSYGY